MARKHSARPPWFKVVSPRQYLVILAVLFGIFWLWLALAPRERGTWAIENAPVLLLVGLIAAFHRRLLLSRISYSLIFVFLCLHSLGAHYTYSHVPYNELFQRLFGASFNQLVGWERNNYDRVVHFLYGLLLAYPVREIFLRVANARGFWGYFLPLDLTLSTSALYELLEWAAAVLFGNGAAEYLGTQGDEWDAHKDMALAAAGALIAMLLTALINRYYQRDFAREWVESLRVKNPRPLGEEAVARRLEAASK